MVWIISEMRFYWSTWFYNYVKKLTIFFKGYWHWLAIQSRHKQITIDIQLEVFYPANFWYMKISGANSDITWVFQYWRYLNFNITWLFQHWHYSNCLVTWNFPRNIFFPRAETRPVVAWRQNSVCSSLVACIRGCLIYLEFCSIRYTNKNWGQWYCGCQGEEL